jgi:hypothetical protein
MARVSGPLYGESAAGVFGGAIAFKLKASGPCVCKRPRPRSFSSPDVLGQLSWFKSACVQWSELSPAAKNSYSNAAPDDLNGFQYFISLFAVSNLSAIFSSPDLFPWLPCFASENIGLLGSMCYLLPGFSSGFIVLLPFVFPDIVRVQALSLGCVSVVSEGCSFSWSFGVSSDVFSCPGEADFVPVSLDALELTFPMGSSLSGKVLWIRCCFSQSL